MNFAPPRIPAPTVLLAQFRAWMHARRVRQARFAQARAVAASIQRELCRIHELRYRTKKDTVRYVTLAEPILLTREEVYCTIKSGSLPPNVKSPDLEKPEILQSLSDRVGTHVRLTRLPNRTLAYATRLSGSTFPATLPINSYKLPQDAPPLAIPLGVDADGTHSYVDLAKLPHVLVIGPTGKGKSTLIHTTLTTWIDRNSPEDMELWLADHKGGAELNRYTALMPKRGGFGLVQRFSYEPASTIDFLIQAQREMRRRLELMRQHDVSDLADYMRTTGQTMRRIVIVIDEIVNLMLNREKVDKYTIGKYAEAIMVELASQGRAAGMHLLISTQVIKSDVLTSLIKANFESRISFGVADHWQSQTAIDDSRAVGLPIGRIILKQEGDYTEYQTPYITPQQVRLKIDRIARYGPEGGLGDANEAKRFRDDAALLIRVACEYFEGRLSRREILAHPEISGTIPRLRFEELCKRLQHDSLILPGSKKTPRMVSPLVQKNPGVVLTLYAPAEGGRGGLGHQEAITQGGQQKPAESPAHPQPTPQNGAPWTEGAGRQEAITHPSPWVVGRMNGADLPSQKGNGENDDADTPDPPPPGWWGAFEE
jgi:energy-coupling factor transporter ATP-binding protein EcfA2